MNTSVSRGVGHLYVQTAWQNVSGVSPPPPLPVVTRYQANDALHQFEREFPTGGEVDITVQDSFELVSLSPTPNFLLHSAITLHFDADGNLISFDVRGGADCSGPA